LPAAALTQHDHADDALERVAHELGITAPRVIKALRDPLVLWKKQNDGTAYDAAAAMIHAWRDYQNQSHLRSCYPWNPRTFFTHGHWLHPESWPTDPKLIEKNRRVM
jgi:hypothetical protein